MMQATLLGIYFVFLGLVSLAFELVYAYFSMYICYQLEYFQYLSNEIGNIQHTETKQQDIIMNLIKLHSDTYR